MTEKLGVNEKEPAFGQKTPTTTTKRESQKEPESPSNPTHNKDCEFIFIL